MTEEQPASVFANREIAAFAGFILRSLDRLVACLAQVDTDGLNWRPPAPRANSLAVLVLHTLGNAEENLAETLGGQPISRQRDQEFPDQAVTLDAVTARWQGLRPRLLAVFQRLTPADLEREIRHPRRGSLVGREVLVVVARHAAEHLGQAELTRDLYLASRADAIGPVGG